MSISIWADGQALPSPTELSTSEEIIWSSNTGRASDGGMIGTVIAEKRTFQLRWGVLTAAEYESIRTKLAAGFHPFTLVMDGTSATVEAYRGTLSGTVLGTFGGATYYKDASVSVIQQ